MQSERTYTNPIYNGYLGDPFVLKYNGEYYAYGTVPMGDCRIPVLHSRDLLDWRYIGEALQPLDTPADSYWAPEVAYSDGAFYMYYSTGGYEGENHQLRIAISPLPTGPFKDSGAILTADDPFTIDAHPFRDEDGQWYLFYSRDFLEGERPGTGVVADRLLDMSTLAGERVTVVRGHADWQLFERQRHWYDRVWDWYTVEGAAVRKHNSRYYCFYSGGLWKAASYGASCVVADHPLGPYEAQTGVEGPNLLRTVPGQIIGPGHLSVTRGPDNLHEYLIYHAWDPEATQRSMRMDELMWTDTGPTTHGPTIEPQPAPPMPAFRDLFDGPDGDTLNGSNWHATGGAWRLENGQAVVAATVGQGAVAILTALPPTGWRLLEVNLKAGDTTVGRGEYGIYASYIDDGTYVELALAVNPPRLQWRRIAGGQVIDRRRLDLSRLGTGFRAEHYHRILIDRHDATARLQVDSILLAQDLSLPDGQARIGLFARGMEACFDGVSLTTNGVAESAEPNIQG